MDLGVPVLSTNPGVLTISLDFELIWGTLDLFGPTKFRAACIKEREVVVDRLLALFEEFDTPATWCVVGHLLLEGCETVDGIKHPDIVRPEHRWCATDWFSHDPCGNELNEPLFFGRDLVERIRACRTPQEIGCHSFSHVIFGDDGCSRATAESEIAECVRVAGKMGIDLRSFAFPRNQVGHLDVLSSYGFKCYRGPEPTWAEMISLPLPLRRAARLLEVVTASTPPVVLPQKNESGLWNIPGSAIYFPIHGIRRLLPMRLRVLRVLRGLDEAARRRRIFHLWFHPTNFAEQTEAMFGGLRRILTRASTLQQRGQLEVLTMNQIAERWESAAPGPANSSRLWRRGRNTGVRNSRHR